MAGTSFSLTQKLAVTGAFLALVALMVGTEDEPGLVVTGQETVKELRAAAPSPVPPVAVAPPPVPAPPPVSAVTPLPLSTPTPAQPQTQPAGTAMPAAPDTAKDVPGQFSPALGRVPRDFSKGPPG